MSAMFYQTPLPSDADRCCRQVWEAVMVERMSLYWRDALFTEADKVFPGIRHANAGRYAWDPEHCPINAGGTVKQ